MNDLLLPSKRWEWRTAFGGNLLAILRSATHKAHNKYEVPNFYLGQSLYTQNKAHIFFFFFNERDKILSFRFEGHFNRHETEGIKMI